MHKQLYWSAAAFTTLGLAGGLFYREFTKAHAWTGGGQLGLVHTHFLTLGTFGCLILLGLDKAFGLSGDKQFRLFTWVYTGGVAVTGLMQLVKGSLQVVGSEAASSKALAGIAGTGHMLLTAALILLFVILRARLNEQPAPTPAH